MANDELPSAVFEDPDLLAFLPLLYVAWADGELEPGEVRALQSRVEGATGGLGPSCQEALGRWLDPDRPPTAEELQELLGAIRRVAGPLPSADRLTLSELVRELAALGGRPVQPREQSAVAEIEEALGLAKRPVLARLFARRAVPAPPPPKPGFEVEAMTGFLDGEQRELRQRVRRLLSQPEFSYVDGSDRGAYREQVLAWCRRLAEEGLGALGMPAEDGGGGDPAAFIAVFETLAFHDLSLVVKFGVQFGLFAGGIQQLGTERHHRRYLRAAGRLELPGCFAMTETGHGSNVNELETTATYDPAAGEFVVETPHEGARKDYIGNAALHGRLAVVFAQLHTGGEVHGVHALLVPIREEDGTPCPGVRIEDCGAKLGLNGVDNGRLAFSGVRVPRENLLDRFGSVAADGTYTSPIASPAKRFFTMLGTLVGGRVSVALGAMSAAKSALTIAVRYGERRRQFGPAAGGEVPILDYLSHQRRLLPRLATTYGLHFALRDLAERYVASPAEDRREVESLAAGLKAFSTWHTTDTIQACREACGGQGYLAENRFAALKADTDVFTTFEGDNTVLFQLLTKGLLTGYRQQYGDMTLLGLVRYLGSRAATAASELNPVITRLTDEEHLRGRDFQLGALQWREDHLLGTLARRLKRRIDGGLDSFQALNECQDHALALAQAHVERVVLDRFAAGADRCPDPRAAAALKTLCDLYALWRIDLDRGWFVEHGVLAGGKARAVRKLVNRLCGELRPHAAALVDAFAIPDALLATPIASGQQG